MAASAAGAPARLETLPNTKLLTLEGDLAVEMVAGIDRFLMRELEASVKMRADLWGRDYSSPEAYARSVAPNRERFLKYIGAVDDRGPVTALEFVGTTSSPSLVATGDGYRVHAVRWPVLDGVDADGLLLQPDGDPVARVVAIPDADWSPEMLVGLAPGVPPEAQFARRLAENGCQVLVPGLIDRTDTWSGNPRIRMTNQPHREFIYRMAFEMGRHIIGYEVQKVLAAVDWFTHDAGADDAHIAVWGHGEGGLLALYSAAADPRIDTAVVSGYFQSRQNVWQEPIYRNVWSLLHEFGDAELASLIAPRALIIEACRGPQVDGPPPARDGRKGAAPGRLVTPPLDSVRSEFERAHMFYDKLEASANLQLVVSGDGTGQPGTEAATKALLGTLVSDAGAPAAVKAPGEPPTDLRGAYDPRPRLRRQFDQLCAFTQALVKHSARVRREFWEKADTSSIQRWRETCTSYRDYLWDEVIGRFPPASRPPNPRTRLAYDEPKWKGYEVVLDVWPDVFAYGILLVPRDLKAGERRPVVVCQHGLEGTAQKPVHRDMGTAYQAFGAQLADRGFVVYSPQNPYIGRDKFRVLQRKANPLKKSLFAVIVRQHERTLEWLRELPFVDPERIGFYGISYGGKTAMRVPALLEGYALSICSADFNEWIWKNTATHRRYTYMFSPEYEMFEFDLGHTFNYAELAALIAPRPFMVERGHHDGVAPDEWVAYEYAKVRRLYAALGIPDRTEIEFFDGGHMIHGKGTFEFLHKHLKWPLPK